MFFPDFLYSEGSTGIGETSLCNKVLFDQLSREFPIPLNAGSISLSRSAGCPILGILAPAKTRGCPTQLATRISHDTSFTFS
jgi:hypothetical protein